jgi:hypothetical protein
MAANQGDDLTIQAVGGRKNLADIYKMQEAQFGSILGVGPQGGPGEEEEAQPNAPPYDLMQAKQGLDKREDAWNAIVGAQPKGKDGEVADAPQAGQGVQSSQPGGDPVTGITDQQMARNVQQQQEGADLDAKQGEITDEELKKYFGENADAVKTLINKRSDVKLSDLLPIKDQQGFDQVLKQLTEREDVQVSDLVEKTADGKVKIDSSVNDDDTKELMENRKDIKPKELTNLRAQLTKALGNPTLAKKAFTEAMKLLKNRTDMRPEEVGNMFVGISDQIDSVQGKGDKGAAGAGAKVEMFETAVDLLCTRRDLNADHIVKLAASVTQTMGDKQDGQSPSRISESFRDAADLMKTRKDISVDQVGGFLGNLQNMTKGKDAAALDNRASIFKTACNTLKTRPDMNFDSMSELLKRQTQGKNPKQGDGLMNDFNTAATGLSKGQSMDQVAAPVTHQPEQKKAGKEDEVKTEKQKRAGAPDDENDVKEGKDEPAKEGKDEPAKEGDNARNEPVKEDEQEAPGKEKQDEQPQMGQEMGPKR